MKSSPLSYLRLELLPSFYRTLQNFKKCKCRNVEGFAMKIKYLLIICSTGKAVHTIFILTYPLHLLYWY